MRQITPEEDKLLRVLEALRYATVQDITITDGRVRRMKIVISVDLADPEAFRRTVEELRTIPL